jgi:hypothetical protein
MQAYSRAALASVTAAPLVSSVSCREEGGSAVVASGSASRSVDVGTAARALASLLLEGLSDHDLAVFARRLLPICTRGNWTTLERAPPRPWHRSPRNSACRPRRSVARLRGTSCRPSSAVLVGSSRQTQSASGRARRTFVTRRPAGGVPRSLPLPRRRAPRCTRFSAGSPKRRVAEFAEVRDERREGSSGRG